ncbi:hypothetical protein CABS03_03067 [Colletotrichum abscissum]|uniref:Uncharacterized protein n=1 Tax=Colletotrichum abscissum TaxID=1671311 RepID=A0A9Q0AWI6_9PEZI|nr:hypothetical protein CABS02_11294 [Colletotrichum abscissum]
MPEIALSKTRAADNLSSPPEHIYQRTHSQQGLGYFPESNCREEGSHTPPSSSIAAATVFTSGPSESSDPVSSPPPTGQSQSDDHPSGVADEDPHDSQATESAPEDDTSGPEEVGEDNRKPCCICPRCPRHSKSWVCQECGDSLAPDELDAPCCCPGPDAESCGSDCEETEVQEHVRSESPGWESVL